MMSGPTNMSGSHRVSSSPWAPEERPVLRRVAVVGGALVAVAAILVGGTLVHPEAATVTAARSALVGRTSYVCTAGSQAGGTSSIAAVAVRQGLGGAGTLVGSPLGSDQPPAPNQLKVTEPGKGAQLSAARAPVVLQAEGPMATGSIGVVVGTASQGVDAGLSAAPCLAPGTQHWFSGVGAGEADRTELILTNPDDTQAEVDLRFFGRRGRVAVPGSPGVVVEARSSRTVSLSTLDPADGPFSVEVSASAGRVSAVARRSRTDNLTPAGVDWQLPTTLPSISAVIPGVPEDDGARDLFVTNPGPGRATVQVRVLGLQGPVAPLGAESVEVGPESTKSVDLAPGLAGEAGAIELTSDQPVTASVVSSSRRIGAGSDLAVQSAAAPLIRTGVSALATTDAGASELMVSNGGDTDAPLTFDVLSYDGVTLRTDEVLVAAHSTATRRLNSPAPSYLVVTVPDRSAVVGGLVLTQPDGDVAGLATLPLVSPDLARRAPVTVPDPGAGR